MAMRRLIEHRSLRLAYDTGVVAVCLFAIAAVVNAIRWW